MTENVATTSPSKTQQRVLKLSALIVALFLVFLLVQRIDFAGAAAQQASEPVTKAKDMEETWGIRIQSIRLTAHGRMVDFRYRVLDPEKAEALFVRKTKAYLLDQASGKVLAVPTTAKVGPLRTSNRPQEGRVYWMFFGNPGVVKAGSKVTIMIGEFKAENLVVE